MIASAQSPTEAARQLIELACARGGRDNVTVFVLNIRDMWMMDPTAAQQSIQTTPETQMEAVSSNGEEKRGLKRFFGK
jgi:serine/threonine protein phosphatase PrpC